jgi:serine/threonine protein kinase
MEEIQKESVLLKVIKHKNIIRYLGSFSDFKNHYIIMEYAE